MNVLSYFDPALKTEPIVDVSPIGIGAILTQIGPHGPQVVSYASRALTETEQRYPQTHREACAITWSILHYSIYLQGGKNSFNVVTDHQPLVHIYNKPPSSPLLRLEHLVMKVLSEVMLRKIYTSAICCVPKRKRKRRD